MSVAEVRIRPEELGDVDAIGDVIRRTYADVGYSDQQEHRMVERLRGSAAFVPELSLVAEVGGEMVGHVLLTRIRISRSGGMMHSLALAPLSVVPEFRDRGVGGALVRAAHRRASELGFGSVVVVGIPGYYPRFGYRPLRSFGLTVDFEVREENCFGIELVAGELAGGDGVVVYPVEWLGR